MRSKAEVKRHHDMDRAGVALRCADRCCGVVELMIEDDSNLGNLIGIFFIPISLDGLPAFADEGWWSGGFFPPLLFL